VIEVSPPPPSSALGEALTEACTTASKPRTCELGDGAAGTPRRVRVVWLSPDEVAIHVEDEEHRREPRRLVFRPNDPAQDRFRALGLFVAAISGTAPEEPAARPRPVLPRQTAAWLGVGLLGGRGLAPGPPRYGAWVRGGYELPRFPAFVSVGVGHAVAARDGRGLRPSFTAIGAGLGLVLDIRPLETSLRPRVGALLERQGVDAFDANTSQSGAGSRWVAGTNAGLELVWPAHTAVSLLLGADLRFLSGGTGVHVGNDYVSSFPSLSYDFSFGLEISGSRSGRRPE
jgi:hypothetical protein